jgi:hypothetical protein
MLMSKRKQRLASELGSFLRQYARPSDPHSDPNDRGYDRKLEQKVRRLSAEEFATLAYGDDLETVRRQVEASVVAFLRPDRRARARQLLASARGRDKFRRALAHFDDWDPNTRIAIPSNEQTSAEIEAALVQLGAPPVCYVMSECAEFDAAELSIRSALVDIVGSGCATLIVCTPGRLGFYEGEEPGERYILRSFAA